MLPEEMVAFADSVAWDFIPPRGWGDPDTVRSDALLGLAKALNNLDDSYTESERKAYLIQRIRGAILDGFRRERRQNMNTVQMDMDSLAVSGERPPLAQNMSFLSDMERQVLELYYEGGETLLSIAEYLGISRNMAFLHLDSARKHCRAVGRDRMIDLLSGDQPLC